MKHLFPFSGASLTFILSAGLALSSVAQDKSADDPFADLFGDTTKSTRTNLEDATSGVQVKKADTHLQTKDAVVNENGTVNLIKVFAAETIRIDKRRGCEPADRARTKVRELTFNELPMAGPAFSVCLTLKSDMGRQMRMTTYVVDPRKKKIGRADTAIDFRGKKEIDHVMAFPKLRYEQPGQYQYVVELEGEPVGALDLLKVMVVDDE